MILMAMLLAISAPTQAAAMPSQVEADAASVVRAAAALAPHVEGTWLDGKPGTDRLAEAQWRAVQIWAADWLNIHPHASAEALAKAGTRFGDDWSISAVGLGRGDILVSASRGEMSNAFILGPAGPDGHRLLWSAAAPQARLNPAADRALALWRPIVQNRRCTRDCRMMIASSVGRLPEANDGSARFWIEASYAQIMGGTIGEQLSLWSWHDGHARPLLVSDFAVTVDQSGPVFRGSILHVPSKGGWNSVASCGGCPGRTTDLRFAIGPAKVRALPPVSLTPEIDLVDRVFSRVLAHRQVGAIASASVLRTVRTQLADRLAETDPQLKTFAGMVMGWKRWRVRGERWACLNVDGAGATAFGFDRSLTRIISARVLEPSACQGKDARV